MSTDSPARVAELDQAYRAAIEELDGHLALIRDLIDQHGHHLATAIVQGDYEDPANVDHTACITALALVRLAELGRAS